MGNDCISSSPMEHYQSYFKELKISEMKDYWTTIQVYKIKGLYDSASSIHPTFKKTTFIQFDNFISLFTELKSYPERQKMRVYEIFQLQDNSIIDWSNFYSMISIIYFAAEDVLAMIMFLIFDESLSKQLTYPEILLMCEKNENCILTDEKSEEQTLLFEPSEIVDELMDGKTGLQISEWLKMYKKYFNMNKFRRIFNIFNEEKLQKQLIKSFNEDNNLYIESQQRYVSYLIDFKWFESWKLYVKQQYGFSLSSANKKPVTFKTKKCLKNNVHGTKKVADGLTLRLLKFEALKSKKTITDGKNGVIGLNETEAKNYDFIHSNIGDKPKEIYNKVLEGDHEQVLRQGIIQNRDYVFVSQKIWSKLKKVYGGYPEFRRTGFDYMELYPKVLKVLPFKKGQFDYQEENTREVSGYYPIEDVLTAVFQNQSIANKKFYYKTIGMTKWEQVSDLSIALSELTLEIIIYIVNIPTTQAQAFEKKHCKVPKHISEINVGDIIKFQHPTRKTIESMVFLGKNIEGKFILHIQGQSYIYNICVLENDILKKGVYQLVQQTSNSEILQLKKKQNIGISGIPNLKGLSYINSVILHLYYNWGLKQLLLIANLQSDQPMNESIVKTLAQVFKDLTNKRKVRAEIVSEVIHGVLGDFTQFSADMCLDFQNRFFTSISNELEQMSLKNHIEGYKIKTQKTIRCPKCNILHQQSEEKYSLSLPIQRNQDRYYEIIFVPFCQNMSSQAEMKRYGFKLKAGATLKQYKQAFQSVAGLTLDSVPYLLMEIQANNIVKNYSTAKNNLTLDELLLRETDCIVAYELKTDFTNFISKHYSKQTSIDETEVKVGQFIDCKNTTRGWIFGKVCEKQFTPYGHRTVLKVIHKFSKGQQWEVSYDADRENIAVFPTRSFVSGEQYHMRLQQRYFNEASNDMEICNMPLVVVLTNWMRWREFNFLLFLQMKNFIHDSTFLDELKEEDYEENDFQIYSSKSIRSKSPKNKKKTMKLKGNKLKEYLYGPNFPYKINFVDYSGRCAICFKFLKSSVFQGQNDTYCSGCQISASEPISWQIKISDVMICVDWKKIDSFKKNLVHDHSSYANQIAEKRNDIETIANCLDILKNGYSQITEQLCCNIEREMTVKQEILNPPPNLTIYLERIVEENGFIKIHNKHVKFEENIKVSGIAYTLVGLTSIQGGSNKSTKYRTFVLVTGDEWMQYDGNIARQIKKSYVEKLNALNLYYKRKQQ